MVALRSLRAAGVQLVAAVKEGREAAEQLWFGEEIAAPTARCYWRLCRWWSHRKAAAGGGQAEGGRWWGSEQAAAFACG